MEFTIGMEVNHKVFGKGVIVNVIDRPSGTASREQYVDVEFENPVRRDSDTFIHPDTVGPIAKRTFSFTSIDKFLVDETK